MESGLTDSVRNRTGREGVYDVLFDRIYEAEYPKGFRLKEVDIAREFGVSRGPVREVLKQLKDVGLVEILPNRGAVVVGLSQDDVEEIYEIRKSLEILAVKFAVPRIRLDELSDFRAEFAAIGPDTPSDAVAELDNALHAYIVETSDRGYLKRMLEGIYKLISRIRRIAFHDPEGIRRATEEHLELIDAIFRRDVERAGTILSAHLERSKNVVLTTLFQGMTRKKSEKP